MQNYVLSCNGGIKMGDGGSVLFSPYLCAKAKRIQRARSLSKRFPMAQEEGSSSVLFQAL